MVNNLGATPPLEMSLVARAALDRLKGQYKVGGVVLLDRRSSARLKSQPYVNMTVCHSLGGWGRARGLSIFRHCQAAVSRVYVGPFMTSLDMAGMSLTLLRLDRAGAATTSMGGGLKWLLSLLDGIVGAPGWPATSAIVNKAASAPVPVPGRDADVQNC